MSDALGNVPLGDLIAAWASSRPQGSSPAEALAWLQAQGLQDRVIQSILPVLEGLWAQAWDNGWEAAAEAAGIQADIDKQRRIATIRSLALQWAAQITATTLALLARVFAAGAVTLAKLRSVLVDAARARQIAQTEVTRLMSQAASAVYSGGGVLYVRWITEPPNPCPACVKNRQAGRWPLGVPFPSGATYPPDHPHCRCALVPA